jgi:hypothetical protein
MPYVIQQFNPQMIWVSSGNEIDVYNPTRLKLLASWQAHTTPIRAMLATGNDLWTLAASGEISIWNIDVRGSR